ncbi:hypothetical protein AGMMS49959_17170 [Planctomycetales bacterium]|nr:hypothetical protein AGMMS49959_17170 [Planctomycetales bacterium]
MANKPKTLKELIDFYYDKFKPLYSAVQQTNSVPMEMLFEINAAFDHLTRRWHYDETEEKVVNTACAHLKRGCFDVFKILVSQTRKKYDELKQTDLSLVDNGEFLRDLNWLWAEIEKLAIAARMAEGDSRAETAWHNAFDQWEPVKEKCDRLSNDFFLSPKVQWAKDKENETAKRAKRESYFKGVAIGVIASFIFWLLSQSAAVISVWF